jgi:nucleoside-diphosphate-sugar epimerase
MNTDGFNSVVKNTTFKRGLYISSSEVYGNDVEAPYKEDMYGYVDILNPRACYPVAKRLAETLCASYGAEYDKDFVTVRPGHIYGPTISPRDSRASAVFSRLARDGKDIVMKSAGNQLRSYCYVYDCASAMLTILINGEKSNAYNISNPNSIVTIKQMADALANHAGVKVIQEEASAAEKASFNLMSNSSLNSEKLEALGSKAAYSLEDGAARTIDILKDIEERIK